MNFQSQIELAKIRINGIEADIEVLSGAMDHHTISKHVVWSALWDKRQELSKRLEAETERLQQLQYRSGLPNRDQRRGALVASMCVGDKVMLD